MVKINKIKKLDISNSLFLTTRLKIKFETKPRKWELQVPPQVTTSLGRFYHYLEINPTVGCEKLLLPVRNRYTKRRLT